jgi:microcystin degradation protein MlrC
MRILIARVSHETNTFSPVPTPVARFCPDGETLLTGQAAIDFYTGTTSCVGRYLAIAKELGAEVVLPVAASAPPSGPVENEAFDLFCRLITDALREQTFDAIMLDLHGAMVTRQHEDGEGELLRRVREVAPDTKLSVSLDMHANIFDGIVSRADVIAGYRTYPHVDHLPTAERAGRTLVRAMRGEIDPVTVWANAPMLPHVMAQGSYRSPNRELQAMADAMERDGEALLASVFTGFPHADVSQAGLSAVVVTDGDVAAAQRLVTRLLDAAWAERQSFTFQTEPLEESVARAKRLDGPVVLLDHCDNSASGGTMDTTTVLAEIIRQGLENVVFFGIYDPEAVQAAMRAGVGAMIELSIGGRMAMPSIPGTNEPLLVRGRVRTLSAGYFISDSPMRRGVAVTMGPMAVLDTGKVEIVLISRHTEPSDLGLFKVVGIDPAAKRYVAIKSRVHWRADLGPIAKHVVECNGTGVCTSDYGILNFENVRRPIFPLDLINQRDGA